MRNVSRVFTSASPWVVGREALLEDAVDDFLHEMTRQKPWLRARYETALKDLNTYLDTALDGPAPLRVLSKKHTEVWLKTVGDRALAERALRDFTNYLVGWGWVKTHPLRQPQPV